MHRSSFTLELECASLVIPADGSADECAGQIVSAVRQRCGVELPVVVGDRDIGTRHAIALGCLANNSFIARLYRRRQTLVDRWYPGSGGHVVQTVARACGMDGGALVLGGSDEQGVRAATAIFLSSVDKYADGRIPWLLNVELGAGHRPLPEDRIDVLGTSASMVPTPEGALPEKPYQSGFRGGSARDYLLRVGMYGPHADNAHFSRSSQLGLRFLYTGEHEDAQRYRAALLGEVEGGVVRRLYHYKSIRMFQMWELLEPCPIFAAAEREKITAAMLEYLEKESGLAQIDRINQATQAPGVFDRHTACEALNLWIGADFFWRASGDKIWQERKKIADRFFEGQVGTDVPITGLTEGYASYLEVYLEWMLWSCPQRIRTDDHVRLWARRVMGLCTNAGLLVAGPQTGAERYPYHLLRMLAFLLEDGGFLHVAQRRERQVLLGNDRLMQFSAGQAYAGDLESRRPDEELGVTVFAANKRLQEWKAPSIGAERGFDRAVGRGGWQVGDDYWMVIGMRSGGKCLPNVGCLAAYERFGQGLITAEANLLYPASASPWRHSGVTVGVEGLVGGMAAGAEVTEHKSVHGGELLAYEVRLDVMHRWVRSIFWMPSAFLLVVDRVEAAAEGAYTMGIHWRCGMEMEITGNIARGAIVTEEGQEGGFWLETAADLELQTEENSFPVLGAPSASAATQEHLLHAQLDGCGGTVEVATLLHAELGAAVPTYRLGQDGEVWTVSGDGGVLALPRFGARDREARSGRAMAKPIRRPAVSSRIAESPPICWQTELESVPTVWQSVAACLVIGTQGGDVVSVSREGDPLWSVSCDSAITALARLGGEVIAGTESGEVLRFDAKGRRLWSHRCQFRQERTFWPWWFLPTPRIGGLAAGRHPQGGREVIVAGTGSTSLNFIDGETGELIADRISEYGLPDRVVAYQDPGQKRLLFLVGHSWLSCGSTLRAWDADALERPWQEYFDSVELMGRLAGGWDTCAARDFWAGCWIEGGKEQLLVLRHGAVNQLTAYDLQSTRPLWDVGIAGAPVGMAVVVGDTVETARVHVVDEYGWWTVFDGSGRQVGAQRVARSLVGIQTEGDEVFLWNRELLVCGTTEGVGKSYELDRQPLGWCQLGRMQGLLGIDGKRLVLQAV
jgi:hypothetical protein